MARFEFKPATKKTARARVALIGPAGSGKTYTALAIATKLGARVAVVDTEHGSASKYAGIFSFDTLEPPDYAPATYVSALEAAEEAGFDVVVLDSLSHAWMGKGGALEQVDNAAKRSRSGNSFNAWREVTPQHNALVEAMLACKAHLIITMRTKTEYVIEEIDGKKVPRKIGLAPVQRDGLEYEFDVTADLDLDNNLIVGKTRCPTLKGRVFNKAGEDVAGILRDWLTDGATAALSPVEEFLGRFRGCGGAAEVKELIAEVTRRKGEFADLELARIRRVAAEALDRFRGHAEPEPTKTSVPSATDGDLRTVLDAISRSASTAYLDALANAAKDRPWNATQRRELNAALQKRLAVLADPANDAQESDAANPDPADEADGDPAADVFGGAS